MMYCRDFWCDGRDLEAGNARCIVEEWKDEMEKDKHNTQGLRSINNSVLFRLRNANLREEKGWEIRD